MGINHPTTWTARFDIGYYHENQGTALLRAMVPFVTKGTASDLWVHLYHESFALWTACYGVLCSKILARLDGTSPSMLNADNYALFALSKYVSQAIEGSFPWLPRLERQEVWSPTILSTFNGNLAVTDTFSQKLISQPNYNQSRYQLTSNTTQPLEVLGKSAVDLTRSVWFRQDTAYPIGWTDQRNAFLNELTYAYGNTSLNMDTKRTLICFRNGTSPPPVNIQPFDSTEASDAAQAFCSNVTNVTNITSPSTVYPAVLSPVTNLTRLRGGGTNGKNDSNTMNFVLAAHPDSFLQNRIATNLFEGNTSDKKADHCYMTYKYIMDECDKNSTEKYGGIMTLNDRIYAAYCSPKTHNASQDIAPVHDFKCSEYNATSYWRTSDLIASMQDARLRNLCTCWGLLDATGGSK
ncbi:hypothetical protein N0V83_010648 [Neocucurbitaria cava]|uniref:Uncharacterized protein n=1 Tax=Neocucurbitaria cava TaxID=798079 RepID=A0A9W8XY12_9PLEO|nr:hypothetical protein N0V83_010648 [Neocucurbitaria cava]